MKIANLLYLFPFLIALINYNYFPVVAVISILIIYSSEFELDIKKIWLKLFFFTFLFMRWISGINLNLTQIWSRLSQQNYSLDYRFIDLQEVFMSLYCSPDTVGDSFLIYGSSRSMTCPYNISYGPFFEFFNVSVNPWTATLISSLLILSLIFIFYTLIIDNENIKNSYLISLFFFSPSLNFVLERMNLDIVIVIVIVASYRFTKREYIRNLIILVLSFVKYYPAIIFISNIVLKVILKKYKTIKIDITFLSIFIGVILLSVKSFGVELKQPIRPIRSDRTFGLLSEANNFQHAFNIENIYSYIFLVIILAYIIFLIKNNFVYSGLYEKHIDFTFLNLFLALSLFANYDYRLIIMLIPIKVILKTKNTILFFSYSLFMFSSPGLLYSYTNHFYLIEDYFFVYMDLPFYFLLSTLAIEYIKFINLNLKNN